MNKSTDVANINVAPGYSKFNIYFQKDELVPEMDSHPLIFDQVAAEVSDDENEVDRHSEYEGAFKKYWSPTQFRLNRVKERIPTIQ